MYKRNTKLIEIISWRMVSRYPLTQTKNPTNEVNKAVKLVILASPLYWPHDCSAVSSTKHPYTLISPPQSLPRLERPHEQYLPTVLHKLARLWLDVSSKSSTLHAMLDRLTLGKPHKRYGSNTFIVLQPSSWPFLSNELQTFEIIK